MAAVIPSADALRRIPLNLLVESKTNPRTVFEPGALGELAASIKTQGIIEPLVVRPVQQHMKPDHFEIVAGARRFRAAKLAKALEVPAIVRPLSDEQALAIQLVENLQREDMTPLDEARGYQRLKTEVKLSVEDIARQVGKSNEHVYARLKLLDLDAKPAKALAEGKISAEHGVLLARLPVKDQATGLARVTDQHNPMNVKRLREWVKERDDDNKTQQRVQGEIAVARAKGEKVVTLLRQSGNAHGGVGVLGTDKYALAGKAKCKHLARGFYLEHKWVGHARQWLYEGGSTLVCTSPATCSTHKPKHAPAAKRRVKSAAEKAAELREHAQERADALATAQVVDRVNGLNAADLKLVATAFAKSIGHDVATAVIRRRGWKISGWNLGDGIARQAQTMNLAQLQGLLVEFAIGSEPRLLKPFAKSLRIDLKKIERRCLAELKAKKVKK